jgi:protein phosphatase/serine/threonine-protein phosphatase Stp1
MSVIRSWALTNVGAVRKHNEDNLLSRPDLGLWAVADGAGGHDSGEVASGMIVEELAKLPAALSGSELLSEVRLTLSRVHQELRDEAARRGPDKMIASTFVALILRDKHFACLWAGDSRAYLLRQNVLRQISKDHSLVQELVDAGRLAAADAERHPHANVITRAVGADSDTLDLDKVIGQAEPGDRFLLCSDGLCKTLSDFEIKTVLGARSEIPPTDRLISAALAQGVNDNVTAVVVEIQ